MNATDQTNLQLEFDQIYITSSEICEEVGVTRVSLCVRKKTGRLPGAIEIFRGNSANGNSRLTLWKRDQIRPYIEQWKAEKNAPKQAIKEAA